MGLEAYQSAVAKGKREDIVRAARDLFLAEGYERTSVAAIAERADVSLATLYKHFRTKSALFESVAGILAEEMVPHMVSKAAGTNAPCAEVIRDYARAYADILMSRDTADFVRLIVSEAAQFPEVAAVFYERIKGPIAAEINAYLERQARVGTLEIQDQALALRQLMAMIEGSLLWPNLLLAGSPMAEGHERVVADEAAATFLARYATPAASRQG